MSSDLFSCPKPQASLKNLPQPWKDVGSSDLQAIRGVCLDIDDTLSSSGKLTASAYSALWDLKEAGFAVVPITGRPAGWCDHFARFWPVHAVVGENGAFTFFMDHGIRKRIDTLSISSSARDRLKILSQKILKRFPHATWASDQSYREYDLAVDICEDVKPWPAEQVNALLELCRQEGAHAKLSSIHVNIWFGDYDKVSGFKAWLNQGAPGLQINSSMDGTHAPSFDEWLFIGDSPNDEPLFSQFKYSVGVANLKKYRDRLQFMPRWITEGESGQGFVEMVEKLIQSRCDQDDERN